MSRLQTILQSYSNQNSLVLALKTDTDRWDRIKSPEINPYIYGQLIFDKRAKNIKWKKEFLQ